MFDLFMEKSQGPTTSNDWSSRRFGRVNSSMVWARRPVGVFFYPLQTTGLGIAIHDYRYI